MDWQKVGIRKKSSVSEHVGTQESLYTEGKTVEWCSSPREPPSSIGVLSQTKYMHTLWCNHKFWVYVSKKFSYRPIRGHTQEYSSKFYLWYQQAGSNLAVYHWNIQGKCKGRLWLAWAGRSNGLDVHTEIWIDFKTQGWMKKSKISMRYQWDKNAHIKHPL